MPDDVKALLGRALDGEPPLGIDRDRIFAEGRARLRRRRSVATGGAAAAVVAAVLGTTALAGGLLGPSADQLGPAQSASAPPSTPRTTTTSKPGTVHLAGVQWPELTDAIRSNRLWAQGISAHRVEGLAELQFQGAVLTVVLDDRSGKRTLIVTIEPPNTLRLFCRAGENCTSRENPDGTAIRTKIENLSGRETAFVNVRRKNGVEVSVVESPAERDARLTILLPVPVLEAIGTHPGLGL
ncbi:hypothetical protein [Actinokineospora sp.]|uniref:hypothetical protein n=1 Tax=Actinokineospora sp. TaxID=1872133 RepID=UPI003D6B9E15